MAKDSDLWFHARGVSGSHCLLRLDPGQSPTDSQIQDAADVAAHLSKGEFYDRNELNLC